MMGSECFKCGVELASNKRTLDLSYYIDKSNEVHNFKYDYSSITNYMNSMTKVIITCPNGHKFDQSLKDHISGNGCMFCSMKCTNTENFIELSNEVHGNKYDYSKSEYISQKTKAIIICPIHGEFKQNPSNHYHNRRGCPGCSESKGEREIRIFLDNNDIEYIEEFTIKGCKDVNKLRFDFYLPEYNTCIEFDGLQHFKPIERFGGVEYFEDIKKKDKIKNEFCFDNKIELIRISYKNLGKVEEVLLKFPIFVEQTH